VGEPVAEADDVAVVAEAVGVVVVGDGDPVGLADGVMVVGCAVVVGDAVAVVWLAFGRVEVCEVTTTTGGAELVPLRAAVVADRVEVAVPVAPGVAFGVVAGLSCALVPLVRSVTNAVPTTRASTRRSSASSGRLPSRRPPRRTPPVPGPPTIGRGAVAGRSNRGLPVLGPATSPLPVPVPGTP
jgi:hypothetical protein